MCFNNYTTAGAGGQGQGRGKVVFLDANGNGRLDAGEKRTTTTDAKGEYTFTGLSAGSYAVRRVVPKGFKLTTPPRNLVLTGRQGATGVIIGSTKA